MDIKFNLENINFKIAESCKKSNRNSSSVKLVAVSKFHPIEQIMQAIDCGQFLFGENRVQEAKEKFIKIYQNYSNVDLHIIGSLQRNKVKDACKIASCIESVDRIELIEEIEKQCQKIDKNIDILFEVHTGEESKSGFKSFAELENVLELFSQNKFSHITPKGFMTMAPFTEDESLIRKSFSTLREYSDKLKKEFPMYKMPELSMGMSGDYQIAIEEGSTIVRIGTSIFGPRNY
jgi:pyridoxal phosphate enzyme (YggS family)